MKKGSVIIDLTIDYSSCIETTEVTTHENPVIINTKFFTVDYRIYLHRMPRTTTKAISNFFLSYLLNYDEEGGFENMLLKRNRNETILYMYKGRHTKKK